MDLSTWFRSPLALTVGQDAFRDDATTLAKIEPEKFEEAVSLLQTQAQLFTLEDLSDALRKVLSEEESDCFAHFVVFLHAKPPKGSTRLEHAESLAAEVDRIYDDKIPQPVRETLRRYFLKLADEYSSVDQLVKARSLTRATGRDLRSLNLICDIRPVFDDQRENIAGFIPITTLHLDWGSDGNSVDVVLTEGQLERLADKVEKAQRKLGALKQYCKGKEA